MTATILPRAADPTHLTQALRRCGVLGEGRVCEAAVESARDTILSQIVRLRLTYEGDDGGAPKSLILKAGLPARAGLDNSGRQEVAFYTKVAGSLTRRLLPRCFEALWDEETNAWHLLLEDLTESHVIATAWPLPPTRAQCESILRARARFHAFWWDDPRLGASIGAWLDADAITRNLRKLADEFARFADRLGDDLSRDRRALYERLIDAGPRLVARYHSRRDITIVQGDAHVWNCFLPRNGEGDDVRLFDWDSWHIDPATQDLAYMMALHWYPDRRDRLERPLLDCYHAALVEHGVRGYDRRALDDDYRLSTLWHIATPVWQAAYSIPPLIWWNNLERIFMAVDDLGCAELLG